MDRVSIIGIIISFVAILGGQMLEGGNVHSLIQFTAFIIVMGGTIGAIMLQSSMKVFFLGMKMLKWVFRPPVREPEVLIEQIIQWSNVSRKGGLLALEPVIEEVDEPFVKKGLQMLRESIPEVKQTLEALVKAGLTREQAQSIMVYLIKGN